MLLNNMESAKNNYDKALNLSIINHEKIQEVFSFHNLGRMYAMMGIPWFREAEKYYLQSQEIYIDMKSESYLNITNFSLGELYLQNGLTEKALENLTLAKKNFLEMGMDYWVKKADEALAKIVS